MLLWKKVAAIGAATAARPPDGVSRADAAIRYTEFGIPHIVANDWVNHSDRTERYSREQWVTERYCEKDILASPSLEVVRVSRR
ncbi:MAG TPA: hypothetical protein VFG15_29880 [Amycolatopsis sp.]|nr:hypothetical protein [Amycolatopsis sp.]